MDRWIDSGYIYKQMDRMTDGQKDIKIDRQMDRQMDRKIDRQIDLPVLYLLKLRQEFILRIWKNRIDMAEHQQKITKKNQNHQKIIFKK